MSNPHHRKRVKLWLGGESIARWPWSDLMKAWWETSGAMQERRDNPASAKAEYAWRCDDGDADSCNLLGLLYGRGSGVAKDPVQAVAWYRVGCAASYQEACLNLGVYYENGWGVAADLKRRLREVPVGFKWFVPGLLDGSCGFGGEET